MIARTTRTPPTSDPAWGPARPISNRSRTSLLALVVMMIVTVIARPPSASADDPAEPDLDRGIAGWLTLRGWLDDGSTPSETDAAAAIPVPRLSEASVLLRLDGRVVGRGSDPDGDERAIRRAFGRALAQARGDSVIRGLPEPWRTSPGRRLTLELELAGPRLPLVGGTLGAAARRLEPGVDGIAVIRGEESATAMPGRQLAIGQADDMSGTLIRLIGQVGLPPVDLPELRRLDSVRLERFRTLRLGQASPGDLPRVLGRSGELIERTPLDQASLDETLAALGTRLAAWQAPTDPGDPDGKRLWLGDYDPIARSHRPFEAPTLERLLAIWALASIDADAAKVPLPDELEEAYRTRRDVGQLAVLAASAAGDRTAAEAWLETMAAVPADSEADDTVGSLARRAAALGLASPDLVTDAQFDEAYRAAWDASQGLSDLMKAFDWLALAERAWWIRHETSSPRIESIRAAREALLVRQLDAPGSDRDGAIPLRLGLDEVTDARNLRLLLGLAALEGVEDPEAPRRARSRRGLEGLVRFARQLVTSPDEAANLPGGRIAGGGVQRGLTDPRQPLAATSTLILALDLLRDTPPSE